jgi:hypothetical protein
MTTLTVYGRQYICWYSSLLVPWLGPLSVSFLMLVGQGALSVVTEKASVPTNKRNTTVAKHSHPLVCRGQKKQLT